MKLNFFKFLIVGLIVISTISAKKTYLRTHFLSTNSTSTNNTINESLVIKAQPWDVTNCNNVLKIKGKSFKDLTLQENYIDRVDAEFIIDVRYIRKYVNGTKCPSNVVRFSKLNTFPQILRGSVNCILFKDEEDKFAMCLNSPLEAEQILAATRTFQSCRLGATLEKYDPVKVNNLLNAGCMTVPGNSTEKDGNTQGGVNFTKLKDFLKVHLTQAGVSTLI